MLSAFAGQAEFGALVDAPVFIDQIIQSAMFKLDPYGVEGAAYTMAWTE